MSTEDQDYLRQADIFMRGLLGQLDNFDPDELEADLAQGVLKITFADKRVCVLNRQAVARQIWLAEGASAWHFTQNPATGAWVDTKGRGDLAGILSRIVGDRIGRSVTLCATA